MIREERMRGYFVGFEFTGDALFEIDRFRRKEGREINTLTVREILDEEIASDLPGNFLMKETTFSLGGLL